ncbi:MAG TPA: hypothetical protein VMC03_15190 [Streptosporangiaceae bacterium]|nr:hypothetical protein [Streptosporangiaceae bacterium]
MSSSDAAPLPRLGEVFFDVRGNSRSMRLSWYADTGVAVLSIWQGGMCTGTFRLAIADLPRMVQTLQRGPGGERPEWDGETQGAVPGAGPERAEARMRAMPPLPGEDVLAESEGPRTGAADYLAGPADDQRTASAAYPAARADDLRSASTQYLASPGDYQADPAGDLPVAPEYLAGPAGDLPAAPEYLAGPPRDLPVAPDYRAGPQADRIPPSEYLAGPPGRRAGSSAEYVADPPEHAAPAPPDYHPGRGAPRPPATPDYLADRPAQRRADQRGYPAERPEYPADRPEYPAEQTEYPAERPEYPAERPANYLTGPENYEDAAGHRPGYPADLPSPPGIGAARYEDALPPADGPGAWNPAADRSSYPPDRRGPAAYPDGPYPDRPGSAVYRGESPAPHYQAGSSAPGEGDALSRTGADYPAHYANTVTDDDPLGPSADSFPYARPPGARRAGSRHAAPEAPFE